MTTKRPLLLSLLLAAACQDGGDIYLPGLDSDLDGDGLLDANDCAPEDATLNGDDVDGDGYATCDGDCDDNDAGQSLADLDGDGSTTCGGDCDDADPALDGRDEDTDGFSTCAGDCDDQDSTVAPKLAELCDGIDNDCDGTAADEQSDEDNDGVTTCDGDCNDGSAAVRPGAVELCDGLDNDCDGSATVGGVAETDGDGDGARACDDCDDNNPEAAPGLPEVCDGIDNNCNGTANDEQIDADLDGVSACDGDCDDADATIAPTAVERCNGIDDDCSGLADMGGQPEVDGDADLTLACADCDDADPARFPGAPELCNGIDDDCDGDVNDEDVDGDGDGLGSCFGDCDDTNPAIAPGQPELCNGADDDCDGSANMGGSPEVDADADGALSCVDCDDLDSTRQPGATELCNGIDDNCDGSFQDEDVDGDGDGLGTCFGDCDDTDASVGLGLPELCDGFDNDCNLLADAVGGEGDGDGDLSLACVDCDDADATRFPGQPEACNGIDDDCVLATTAAGGEGDADLDLSLACADCDDLDSAIHPGATETCDGLDQDCNGLLDGPGEATDADGDGSPTCVDCDDASASNTPGGVEICDGADNDCDPGTFATGGEADGDGDSSLACEDCDDADAARNPGAIELCDGIDNDCDGIADDPAPLFVKGQNGSSISTWTWDGSGFGAPVTYDPPGTGTAYTGVVADFDDNGALDFIVERYTSFSASQGTHFYSGSCAGGFTSTEITASLVLPGSADLYTGGDLDGDGDIDLVGWDWNDGEGWTWLNGGTGATWTRIPSSAFGTRPFELANWDGTDLDQREHLNLPLVDIDEDGIVDIVECANEASAPTECVIHKGDGDGTFTNDWDSFSVDRIVNGFALADFDGDGQLEMIGGFDDDGDPGQAWRWTFDGALQSWPSGLGTESVDVTADGGGTSNQPGYGWPYAYDWTGDGLPDLLVTHMEPFDSGTRSIEYWANDGSGGFTFVEQMSATHAWGTSNSSAFVFDPIGVPIVAP